MTKTLRDFFRFLKTDFFSFLKVHFKTYIFLNNFIYSTLLFLILFFLLGSCLFFCLIKADEGPWSSSGNITKRSNYDSSYFIKKASVFITFSGIFIYIFTFIN